MATLINGTLLVSDNYEDGWRERETAKIAAWAADFRAKHEGDTVGEVLRWPRADSHAEYMVVSESPLKLIHMSICDAWTIEPALIRGLRLTDVRAMVERERAMRELFASRG
jgi:hypothetical protein